MSELHNVTFYVGQHEFEAMREFYAAQIGLPVVFEVGGHICCFRVTEQVAVCIHEAEPPVHPPGTQELFFWSADVDPGDEIHLVDPVGNQIRVHAHE